MKIRILWMLAAVSTVFSYGQEVPAFKIRANVQLVEVYAKVLDKHGKYLSDLSKGQFEIRDNGELCPVESFEPVDAGFSCAILMDRTGSILATLPALKNSIIHFIDAFRSEDSLAVYEFNTQLRKAQDFTQNKNAAKQAVLRAMANGATALFDSISEVLMELSIRSGKKVVIAFTDGQDNSSYITSSSVMRRAKSLGIPLYFVAMGEALREPKLLAALKEMSQATSGTMYEIGRPSEMENIFRKISRDLQNSYLLTYAPPVIHDAKWRTIQLTAKGLDGAKIQAREGYFPIVK
jgi:Ca-activated chloride channel homolog